MSDDALMQDEPIAFRVLDGDALVGTVYVPLHPLMRNDASDELEDSAAEGKNRVQGWFPIYDTLQGIRGELRLAIKLQFFQNENPFKDSSAGVRLYGLSTLALHTGEYGVDNVLGVADELVVHKDPEYEWKDSIRTARNSNEKRQLLLYRLSCALRRRMGKKAIEMGGNAVPGYIQSFDVEGDSGIQRGIGVCKLSTSRPDAPAIAASPAKISHTNQSASAIVVASTPILTPQLAATNVYARNLVHYRSVYGEFRQQSRRFAASKRPGRGDKSHHGRFIRRQAGSEGNVVLLTLTEFPWTFVRLAGVVCARR